MAVPAVLTPVLAAATTWALAARPEPAARPGWPGAARCDTLAAGASVPPAALGAALRRLPPQPPGAARSYDADLADIARQVPGGFAGYFLEPAEPAEADGPRAAVPPRTVVRLARPAEGAAALAALAPRLAPYHGGTADVAGARVLPARWDFAQLYDWQRYIGARLRGAVRLTFGDIDEVGNRLVLGVGTERERRALLRRLPRLGVPCGLVEVALVRYEVRRDAP